MRESISQEPSLLISADALALLLNVSKRSIVRLKAAGKLPPMVPIGRGKWRRDEIERWLAADCPTQSEWKALNGKGGSR